MKIRPLNNKLDAKLKKLRLVMAYNKAKALFELNPRHPSLHYEILQGTQHLNPVLRSFRINIKYRVEGYELGDEFCPINVSNHYR